MATTFTWSILQMQTYPNVDNLQNFVSAVEWQLTGTDGVKTASTSALFAYRPEDITSFTSYDQLIETEVLGWVQDRLGSEGIAHFQQIVQTKLDQEQTTLLQPENKPLPWNN